MREAAIDILVRGAGPVGCAAALALDAAGLRVALAPPPPDAPRGFRPIALSHASRLILERLGAWEALSATPIDTIHVSQLGGFGRTRIDAEDAGVPSLGYVVEYDSLLDALRAAAARAALFLRADAVDVAPRCEVHAEGSAGSPVERDYGQCALVALVTTSPPAARSAHERFGPTGPLALLPLAGRYALIWTTSPAHAEALAAMEEERFLRELARAAGSKVGAPVAVQDRSVQRLALRMRTARYAGRAVYIGNAAQTLHPVAGQGLNLGLRDAWDLAAALRDAPDPGAPEPLEAYARSRRLDVYATVGITDTLAQAFLGSGAVPRALRGAALTALDLLPWPRRFFARRMIYGPSALP